MMMIRKWLGMGLILASAGLPADAQTAPKSEKPKTPTSTAAKPVKKDADDLAAIRSNSDEFVTAFNAGDAQAVAALWTKDGDYVNESAEVFSGREAIEAEYAKFFAAHEGAKIKLVIDSLRLLSDSAAIEDGHATLEGSTESTKYMAVHVKVGGKWLMSTVRDTGASTPSAGRDLDDLDFLIGTWVAEEYGSRTESVCRWVAGKSFVERSYTVTHPDSSTTSGVQLIGYNPLSGQIQSWNFSSDGGFAVGTWTAEDQGWSAEIQGATGTGVVTSAINRLKKLDDNAYSWQSVSRMADGVALPDTDEVIMKRSAH